jgi:hypothetical protein
MWGRSVPARAVALEATCGTASIVVVLIWVYYPRSSP